MALAWVLVCLLVSGGVNTAPEPLVDEDDIALQEEVEFLLAHPIDLNRATVDELLAIPWLDPVLAFRIIAVRDSLGHFDSQDQLQLVPGISPDGYDMLAQVVTVASKEPGWDGSMLVRLKADTVPFAGSRWSSLARIQIDRGGWQARGILEKDNGEPDLTDWLGMGLGFKKQGFGFVLGDYTFGSGLGLVFSGPYRRGGARWDTGVKGPAKLRPVRSALENRGLRGAGIEVAQRGWEAVGFGSYAGRDARLHPDGTVARLRSGGVHDDSASRAEHNRVDELSFGTALSHRWHSLGLTAEAGYVRYSRDFAPDDSSNSFFGRSLAVCGIGSDIRTGAYRLGIEAGVSTTGGVAGAIELAGDWQGLRVGLGVSGYGEKYFAPLGRWRSMTGRKNRLYARTRIGYRTGGFRFWIRGNTYRDFAVDSLPARLEVNLNQRINRFSFGLRMGRSYKLEQRRFRNSRCDLGFDYSKETKVTFILADEYPEQHEGRGRMAAVVLRTASGPVWAVLTGGRFDMAGTGVRLYLSEYGPMRVGFSYGTSESAWRGCLGFGLRLSRGTGVGFRLGCTWKETPAFELGGQIELGLN